MRDNRPYGALQPEKDLLDKKKREFIINSTYLDSCWEKWMRKVKINPKDNSNE